MTRHPLLVRYPIVIELPVQWGEMDAYGHVNNAVFFRYFESARIEFLARSGFVESREQSSVGAILHSTSARFRQPLFYPDTIQVGAVASEITPDRFTMHYVVVSLTTERIVAEGTGVVVSFDYRAGKKTDLPETVVRKLAEIEKEMLGG
jgi:acyl-CoA thioester hydrolase